MTRLLLLNCSKQKKTDEFLLPAIERYNGPRFQLLRRFLDSAGNNQANLKLMIFSAEFGLIDGDYPIPYYDRLLSAGRAQELIPFIKENLTALLTNSIYAEVWLDMGKTYMMAVENCYPALHEQKNIKVAKGSPGQRLTQLKQWLYPKVTTDAQQLSASIDASNYKVQPAKILTPVQLQAAVLEWKNQPLPKNGYWAAIVEDQLIPAKWLVSYFTGRGVSLFHTDYALRWLKQAGLEVIFFNENLETSQKTSLRNIYANSGRPQFT